ncbi:MAG: hypothetical protein ACTSPB_01380 [Candidatus Thorarchaeota archaeon]
MTLEKSGDIAVYSLDEVFYDARARDGTWCTMPYDKTGERADGTPIFSHPDGCPNFPKYVKTVKKNVC